MLRIDTLEVLASLRNPKNIMRKFEGPSYHQVNSSCMKPKTIEEYIDAAPIELRERLWQLHEAIRSAAPGASEALKWSMPAYSYQKILVAFAVLKKHTGFYPMPSAIKAFKKDLAKYKTAEGSIQFPHDKPLPLSLVRKIVKFRVNESKAGTIKWKQ